MRKLLVLAVVALGALGAAGAAAEGGTAPEPVAPPLSLARFLSLADDFGPDVEEPEKTLEDALTTDEDTAQAYEDRERRNKEMKSAEARTYQAIDRYASKKLTNLRFGFTIFNVLYREMKSGSAGWAKYDDLFASGAVLTRVHAGDASVYIPTGGFEISFVGAPLYHVHLGVSYDAFTGLRTLGQEFSDFFFTSCSLGLRLNFLNEYVATQKFAEMFEYEDPVHITGLNLYLKGSLSLNILNRVLTRGNLNGPGDDLDTYFNQTQSFGYTLLMGFEYRVATVGLFLEAGWTYIRHPHVARPLVEANHFRSFPVLVGLTYYFGG